MLQYSEIITTQGISVPFDPRIITPKIERPMRNNRYEGGECSTLRKVLRPGDRVLELGAGLGLCSTVAALADGVERVVTIEANPELVPLIRETHRLNGVADRVDLRNAVACPQDGEGVPFYIRPDFWASSMEGDSRAFTRMETLPALGLPGLLAEVRPTVMVCDIEGGELGLFEGADLSGVRHLVLELHPKVYGVDGLARIGAALESQGLYPAPGTKPTSTVQLFERRDGVLAPPKGSHLPPRAFRPWAKAARAPRVLVTTCMKDEGPFILEWLAWHRAVGVTDFVVFTNDCSDGTDRLLEHLAAKGELTHLPNPALATGSPAFQPVALAYTHFLPAFRDADFVISMDVDEFLNIRAGRGHLTDLFAATGPFDAISLSELNHGANGQVDFVPGWIRPQFPRHESETPGNRRARKGVKTITRLSPRLMKLRNHRPDLDDGTLPPRWLDGSGRFTDWFQTDATQNGTDARGCYDLAVLDHYALRSLGSFFMKTLRGDVVVANKQVSLKYWKTRNRAEQATSIYSPAMEDAALAWHRDHHENDPALMALHEAACAWHQAKIAEVSQQPEFAERRAWIMANAWSAAPDAD